MFGNVKIFQNLFYTHREADTTSAVTSPRLASFGEKRSRLAIDIHTTYATEKEFFASLFDESYTTVTVEADIFDFFQAPAWCESQ